MYISGGGEGVVIEWIVSHPVWETFLKVAVRADLTVCFVALETSEDHSLCTHNYLPIF